MRTRIQPQNLVSERGLSDCEDNDYDSSEAASSHGSIPPEGFLAEFLDDDEDEEAEEGPKVVSHPPPPPPPGASSVIVNKPEPPRVRLMRGIHAEDRLVLLDQHHRFFIAKDQHFPIPVERVEELYRERWPEATQPQIREAAILIDDIVARQLNVPVWTSRAGLVGQMKYRDALQMTDHQDREWSRIEGEPIEERHISFISGLITPEFTHLLML